MTTSPEWEVTGRTEYPAGDNPLDNRFYGYAVTSLTLPDGRPAQYSGVVVGDCVHAVALEDDLTTYLVRQRRPNLLRSGELVVPATIELPGGFADSQRSLAESAAAEVREEIHRDPAMVEGVGTLYTSPGISNERDHIFMATMLGPVRTLHEIEDTEQDMDVIAMPFGKAYDMLRSGSEPVAAQTLGAMTLVAARL